DSLELARDLGHLGTITATDLMMLAHITADCGMVEQSVCLFAAVEELRANMGDKRTTAVAVNVEPGCTQAILATWRAKLTSRAFEAAWAAGQAMTMAEAVEYALTTTVTDVSLPDSAAATPARTGLTRRETEILRLVAGGNSNQQIASELVLSLR